MKINSLTAFDLFIRRDSILDHRDRMPTSDDVNDVCIYLEQSGYGVDKETVHAWLVEEHLDYLSSTLTRNN